MKLIFLGPPGAGKGTLAILARDYLQIPHISTGEIFRAAIKNKTELGLKVKDIIDAGGLVPDELTIELVKVRLQEKDAQKGFILDGFPRTIPQAVALDSFAPVDKVIDFDISNEAVIERLSGRRVCKGCGKNYHIKFMPSKKENICDVCGGELFIREDDKKESIVKRISVYREQTEPLIDHYRKEKNLIDVDASPATEIIFEEFKRKI